MNDCREGQTNTTTENSRTTETTKPLKTKFPSLFKTEYKEHKFALYKYLLIKCTFFLCFRNEASHLIGRYTILFHVHNSLFPYWVKILFFLSQM